jgi:uncharacterized protein YndB with AHSA1/START domain
MIVVLLVLGAVSSAFLAILAGGLLLPRQQAVSHSVTVRATPSVVWAHLVDPASYPLWQRRTHSVQLLGVAPRRWREFGTEGSFAFEVVSEVPHERFVATAVDDDVARRPERAFLLTASAEGTAVTYTERCTLANPISRFVFRYLWTANESVHDLLTDLRRVVEGASR